MPQGPRSERWRDLLAKALVVIDSLTGSGYGRLPFRFGGGTVLMFSFDHRISNDIDLFIDDAQALSFLSPRLNDAAARLADEYSEQANTIKLVLREGDIDFIVAGNVTGRPVDRGLDFESRTVPLEPVTEILAKKLLYRGASLKSRDVFDLAVALALDRNAAFAALVATRGIHPVVLARLAVLRGLGETALFADLEVTETGRQHGVDMVDRVAAAIEHLA